MATTAWVKIFSSRSPLLSFSALLGLCVTSCTEHKPARLQLSVGSLRQALERGDNATLTVRCADIQLATTGLDLSGDVATVELDVPVCPAATILLEVLTKEGVAAYAGVAQAELKAAQTTEVVIPTYRLGEARFVVAETVPACAIRVENAASEIVDADRSVNFVGRIGNYVARCTSPAGVQAEASFVISFASRATVNLVSTEQPVTPALVFSPNPITLVEGGSQTVLVRLNSAPSGIVDFTVSTTPSSLTVSPAALSFNASNWFVDQPLALSVAQNTEVGQAIVGSLSVTAVASDDPDFAGVTSSVPVTITDDDFYGALLTGQPRTSERPGPDQTTTLRLRLGSIPTAPVTVFLAANGDEISLSQSEFTFTPQNALEFQDLVATGVDDASDDGDQLVPVSFSFSSDDANFDGLLVPAFDMVNWDDEVSSVVITNVNPNSPSSALSFTLSGFTEPNGVVQALQSGCAGPVFLSTTTDASGNYSITLPAQPNTTTPYQLKAVSERGYEATECQVFNYTNDTIPPAQPPPPLTNPSSPSNQVNILIEGTGQPPFHLAEVYTDPTCSGPQAGSGVVDVAGVYSVAVTITNTKGNNPFFMRLRDEAGNVSPCSNAVNYLHDDTVSVAQIGIVSPVGSSSNISLNITTEPFASVQCIVGIDCTGSNFGAPTTANPIGSASCSGTIAGPGGSYSFVAFITDQAGNTRCTPSPATYFYDTEPPTGLAISGTVPSVQGITLNWLAATDANAQPVTYDVVICPGFCADLVSNPPPPDLQGITGLSRSFAALTPCGQYEVGVRAVDSLGQPSAYVSTSAFAGANGPDNVKLVPFLGKAELSWNEFPGATSYQVEARNTLDQLIDSGSTVANDLIAGFDFGAGYAGDVRYTVRSQIGACTSLPSSPITLFQAQKPTFQRALADEPANPANQTGAAVAIIDDINGDGFLDLAVGTPAASSGAGRVDVLDGRSAMTNQRRLLQVLAPAAGDTQFGAAIALVADVTGDTVAEVAVGAPGGDGAAYVFDLVNQRRVWRAAGASGERFGSSVSRAPDGADADTVEDVAVGAPGFNSDRGRVYVLSGFSGPASSQTLQVGVGSPGDGFGSSLACCADSDGDGFASLYIGAPGLPGSNGSVYVATSPSFGISPLTLTGLLPGGQAGTSLALFGDHYGTGIPSLAIGSPGQGEVLLINTDTQNPGPVLSGPPAQDYGRALGVAGDLDLDGAADLWIGAPGTSGGSPGYVELMSLHDGINVVLARIDGSTGKFGSVLAGGRDVDHDGLADLLVGAPERSSNAGAVYLQSLLSGPRLDRGTAPDVMAKNGYGLGRLRWSRPTMMTNINPFGMPGPLAFLALQLSSGGSFDGAGSYTSGLLPNGWLDTLRVIDGFGRSIDTTFAVQEYDAETTVPNVAVPFAELGMVVAAAPRTPTLGGEKGFLLGLPNKGANGQGEVRLMSATGTTLLTRTGSTINDHLGSAVAALSDMDGDGVNDFLVSEKLASGDGRVSVLSGVDLSTIGSPVVGGTGDGFGTGIAPLPDLNGDGVPEYAASAPFLDGLGTNRGRITVHNGANPAVVLQTINGQTDNENLGKTIAWVGAVNGTFNHHLAVSTNAFAAGGVRLYNLQSGALLWTFTGAAAGDETGAAIKGGYDFDLDGFNDVVIGSPGGDTGGTDRGRVSIVKGSNGLAIADRQGMQNGGKYGSSVDVLGDIDDDGRLDVMGGAPLANSNFGRVLIDSCANPGCTGGSMNLIYQFQGSAAGKYGSHVLAAGDFNEDGRQDMLITAPEFNAGGGTNGQISVLLAPAVVSPVRPRNVFLNSVSSSSAEVTWTGGASPFRIEYRPIGGTWAAPVSSPNPPATITGLESTRTYEVRVHSAPSTGMSMPSDTALFVTTAP